MSDMAHAARVRVSMHAHTRTQVSTVLGVAIPEERQESGWVEGVAIWVAIAVVVLVGGWQGGWVGGD